MNLWPNDFTSAVQLSPLQILMSQSELFDPNVNNCTSILNNNGEIVEFGIFPFDNSLRAFALLEIHHPDGYPCKIAFDGVIKRCKTEAEFIRELAWVFNHAKTKMMITKLIGDK